MLTKTGQPSSRAPSYTDVNAVIPSKAILAGIAIFVAVLFIVTAVRGNWRLPAIGVGLMVVAAIAVGGIYPAVVQRFQVQPNQQDAEARVHPAQHRRDARRVRPRRRRDHALRRRGRRPRRARCAQDADTTASIRLLDPQIVSPSFKQLQQNKRYYDFPDSLSVDRYEIDGESRDTVIAVRELDLDGPGRAAAQLDQRPHRLHPRLRRRRRVRQHDGRPTGAPDVLGGRHPVDRRAGRVRAAHLLRPEVADVLDRRRARGHRRRGSSTTRTTTPSGQVNTHVPDAGRLRRPERSATRSTKLLYALKFGSEQILFSDRVTPRLADPLRPRPARARRRRSRRTSPSTAGCTPRSSTAGSCGSSTATRRPTSTRTRRRASLDDATTDSLTETLRDRPGAAAADRQLHPQLGQGHGRRLRRLGHAVRVGRRGPDPQGVARGVPDVAQADLGDRAARS